MKDELEKKLYEKYPKIFKQKDLSMKETCMCWGIEHGDGWFDLLNYLCFMLQFNTDRNKFPQVEATQVKEKFGSLRFYYVTIPKDKDDDRLDWKNGYIDGLVSFAESMSNKICEKCGSTEQVKQTEGWVKTICKECKNKK